MQDIIDRITDLAAPVLADLNLELVEVQFRRERPGWVLRLIIDAPGGITVDDCARASREIDNLLEVEDPIEHAYNLEVSSPGLDRPLKTAGDFHRNLERMVRVTLRTPLAGGGQVITGTVIGVTEETLSLATENETCDIPLREIAKARREIVF